MGAIDWLTRAEAVALGWTLLHFCWQGTALALAYAAVDRVASRATSSVRYAIAVFAMALMPLAVVSTFFYEMRTQAMASPSSAVLSLTSPDVAQQPSAQQQPSTNVLPTALTPMLQQPRAWLSDRVERLLPWIDGLWMAGVLLLALRAMGGWLQLERLRQRARRSVPAEIEQQFRRICARMHVGRQLSLRISDEVISPMVMGVWHATVILPISAVLRMPPSELEAVLAHELGHIRRWDYLCNLFQTATESILFFHPAVWWLSRAIRERREVCCDEIAVEVCADPVLYAQALLRLEEEKTARLTLAMALKGSNGLLLRRITQVLGEGMTMESRMTSGMRIAVAGVVVLGLLVGPKVREAVAAPAVAVLQPVVSRVVAEPQSAAEPQIPAPAPAPAPTPSPAPADVQINTDVHTDVAPDVVVDNKIAVSSNEDATSSASVGSSISLSDDSQDSTSDSQSVGKSATRSSSGKGSSYIDGMRAAGYPMDLNKDFDALVSMKAVGVTPEYAKAMANAGLGTPSAHDLISLKAVGVSPEYVSLMTKSGLGPKDFHEAITEKAVGITPEYASAMKQVGLTNLDLHELISLKAQGMTPEYAQWLKREFPQITTEDLKRAAVFHLDEKFMADAKSHGFDGKDLDKLLKLKMSGLLDN